MGAKVVCWQCFRKHPELCERKAGKRHPLTMNVSQYLPRKVVPDELVHCDRAEPCTKRATSR